MSGESPLSPAAQALLQQIESYDELETLLLVDSEPARGWTRDEIAERLGMASDTGHAVIAALTARSLLSTSLEKGTPEYRLGHEDPRLRETAGELARAYAESRVEVVRSMAANAIERVRSDAVRAFGGRRRRDD